MRKTARLAAIIAIIATAAAAVGAEARSLKAGEVSGEKLRPLVDEWLFYRLTPRSEIFKDFEKSPGKFKFWMPGLFADIALGRNAEVAAAAKRGDDLRGFYPIYCYSGSRKAVEEEATVTSPVYLYDSLMAAALFGNAEAARILLASGADPNARRDRFHHTALECAALGGRAAPELATLLIEAGADRDSAGAALVGAAHRGRLDLAEFLISRGADPDYRSGRIIDPLQSPLLVAADSADLPMVELLLARGADPNQRSVHGAELFQELLDLRYIGKVLPNSKSLYVDKIYYTSSTLHLEGSSGATAAIGEALNGKLERTISASPLQVLLGGYGQALTYNRFAKLGAKREGAARIAAALLAAGVSADDPRPTIPPLHLALKQGADDIAAMLLAAGASPTAKDWRGDTPLKLLFDQVQESAAGGRYIQGGGPQAVARAMLDATGGGPARDALKLLMLVELKAYAAAAPSAGTKAGDALLAFRGFLDSL